MRVRLKFRSNRSPAAFLNTKSLLTKQECKNSFLHRQKSVKIHGHCTLPQIVQAIRDKNCLKPNFLFYTRYVRAARAFALRAQRRLVVFEIRIGRM